MTSAPVNGWGIDLEIDPDGTISQTPKVLSDEYGLPVEDIDAPRVELVLLGGPFHDRHALWHDHPFVFLALLGDEVASYVQARRTVEFAQADAREYVFLGTSKLWDRRRKLKLVW
jgi:hypothetical protein